MLDTSLIFDGTLGTGLAAPTGVAITTTRVSTNVLDLLVGRDLGVDSYLGLHVDATVAFTATVSTTLTIDFEVCDTAGGSYLSLLSSPVIPKAQLIAGAPIFRYSLPLNQVLNATAGVLKTPGRFVRLNYTVATGPFSAGSVFAYMNPNMDRQQYTTYPNAYTVTV